MLFKRNLLYAALLSTVAIPIAAQTTEQKENESVTAAKKAEQEVRDGKRLGSVVVTAQKREQSAQTVPVAIAVISGNEVLDRGIYSSNDIQRLAPGLSGQQSGFSRPRWFIRGIGSNDPNLTTESPLGVYNDEVFTALTSLQSFPIFDLERVEVLRGPQGTLWGKNTTAGAVNYISRRPDFVTNGYVRTTAGDWGSKSIQGGWGGRSMKIPQVAFLFSTTVMMVTQKILQPVKTAPVLKRMHFECNYSRILPMTLMR